MYELSDREYEGVLQLNADYRAAHFQQKFKEHQELVILLMNDDSGPYFIEDVKEEADEEDAQVLPVWCHERYAQSFAQGQKLEAHPQIVTARAFIESWVPFLSENGMLLGLMPLADEESEFSVSEPSELEA